MTNWKRVVVPESWSLVRERALANGLNAQEWYSEQLGCLQRSGAVGKEREEALKCTWWLDQRWSSNKVTTACIR